MTSIERVQELLSQEHPVFTVPALSDIADECGIEYRKALSFIYTCRAQGKSTKDSLEHLMFCYRPDLLHGYTDDKLKP